MKSWLIFLFPLSFHSALPQMPGLFLWECFQLESLCQAEELSPGHAPQLRLGRSPLLLLPLHRGDLHTVSGTTFPTSSVYHAISWLSLHCSPPFSLSLSCSPSPPWPHSFTLNQFSGMDRFHLANIYQRIDNIRLIFWKSHSGYTVKLPWGECDKRSHWDCLSETSAGALAGDDCGLKHCLSSGDGVE